MSNLSGRSNITRRSFPDGDVSYLVEIGITRKICSQFLYEQMTGVFFKGHTYTSDGQVWILYDIHDDVHDNFRVGATDHDGKILRDILKVDFPDMLSYIRNKKIDSIIS